MTETTENAELEAALEADQADHSADAPTPTEPAPPETDPDDGQAVVADVKTASKKTVSKKKSTPRKVDTAAETRKQKTAATKKAVADAVAETPPPQDITEEEAAELKRKDDLQNLLLDAAQQIQDHEDAIEELKGTSRDLMAQLYPHTVESDRHVDAVRGYLKASQDERQNRGAHPARLRELLAKAGKAPIDAAFQRARYRGGGRPTRSLVGNAGGPAQDQAKGATPGAEE